MEYFGIPKTASTKEEREERAKAIKKRLGATPAVLGGAVMVGAPAVTSPLLTAMPGALYKALRSGKDLSFGSRAGGKPIEDVTEFSPDEVKAIRGFAAAENVEEPIVAGPMSQAFAKSPMVNRTVQLLEALGIPVENAHANPRIELDSTSIPTAMHEIGHMTEPPLGNVWRSIVDASKMWPGKLTRGAIGATALTPPDDTSGKIRKGVYDYAPALVGATYLPELAEEARATVKAVKGAREFGPGIAATLKELAPAWATYAGHAGGAVLATMLAQRLVKYLYDSAEQSVERKVEKKAAAGMPAEPKMSGALRAPASSAWHMGSFPKPKTTTPAPPAAPGGSSSPATGMAQAKPPSNRSFFTDMTKSLNDPARGVRNSLVSG